MANKMIGSEPMTKAEKQRRYREKKKAELEVLRATPILPFEKEPAPEPVQVPDIATLREQIKEELKKSWLMAERLAAERKEGRRLARIADQTSAHARVTAICDCADLFVRRDRVDIARFLLHYFMITREIAVAALEADKRVKNMSLASLDKAEAWKEPPKFFG